MDEVQVHKELNHPHWEEETGPVWYWFVYTKPAKLTVGFGGCWFPGEFYALPVRNK